MKRIQKPEKESNTEININRRQEWLNILLGFVTLEIAILSIERAKWLPSSPSLTFVLILAVAIGLVI